MIGDRIPRIESVRTVIIQFLQGLDPTRVLFWQSLTLLIIGGLNAGLGVLILRTRTVRTAKPVFVTMIGIATWTVSQGLLLVVTNSAVAFVMFSGMHIGAVVAVTGVLHFSLSYADWTEWLEPRRIGAVYAVTAIWCLLFLSHPVHEWLYVSQSYAGELIPVLGELKMLYWAHLAYDWTIVSLGLGVLLVEYRSSESGKVYKRQAGLIVAAVTIPFVPNLLAYSGTTSVNYSHWAFGATGLLIAMSVYRYQWLDLIPVGRDRVIEQVRDGYLVIDDEWRIVDLNPSTRKFLDAAEPVGRSVESVFPGCLPLLRGEQAELQLSLGAAVVSVSASPVTTERGDGYLLMLRDITEQRRAEQRFQALIENVSDVITVVDEDGTITYESPSVAEVIGIEASEMIGNDVFSRVHPDDRADAADTFTELVENPGTKERFEYRIQDVDGSWLVLEGVGTNPPDDDVVEGIVLASRDVTDRQERERELEQLNTRLQLALEGTNTGVWAWNLEDNKITVDEQAEQLLEFDSGAFTGEYHQLRERIHPEDRDDIEMTPEQAAETGSFEAEYRLQVDGETVRWLSSQAELFSEEGESDRLIGIVSDITDRKRREQELEETKRSLEQSNEKLEQFAGVVSHDLRNPLSVISSRVELARETDDAEHLEKVDEATHRMEQMIADLLTLSRAGQIVEDSAPVSLAVLADQSWENVQTDGGDLAVDVSAETTIQADRQRLQRVFENLYRNALEHNSGPLTIRVGVMDGKSGFFIADDGSGIPENEREEIFEHGYTTKSQGTGFGLSIVQEVAEAHDWGVSATESQDGGARFEFTDITVL